MEQDQPLQSHMFKADVETGSQVVAQSPQIIAKGRRLTI